MTRTLAALCVASLTLAVLAPAAPGLGQSALPVAAPAAVAEGQVSIHNFTFSPARLTVKAGTTVTFTNDDDIPHLVVATGGEFRSGALDTGDNYSRTFAEPGTYAYYCGLHPHMQGTIVVEP
jgi:plastocyanin